jgi:DNA-binding NtrC family response regulator
MLTGRWPHDGNMAEMIAAKQALPAPRASAFAPATPDDLDRLCADLLHHDPLRRPSALDVSRRFSREAAPHPRRPVSRTGSMGRRFVGRRHQLEALAEIMTQTRTGVPRTVWIRGESGVGKSALLRRFADEARSRYADAVVL